MLRSGIAAWSQKEGQSTEERALGGCVLDCLALVARSYHNCEVLLEMGLLNTVDGILKVSHLFSRSSELWEGRLP